MYEHESPYHRLRVTESDGVRRLSFERKLQSSMRIDDPFETDIDYVNYLHTTMAVRPDARRTLAVGLGGGSLIKRMWRDYPEMHIDVIELDPAVIEVARRFFELPDDPRINVVAGDGRAFIASTSETYDIMVIDAFDDVRVPLALTTEEFMRSCHLRLNPDGVLAYNVFGAVAGLYSKPFRSLYRTLSSVWRTVWVFAIGMQNRPAEEIRNIVLLATDSDVTTDELLGRIASRVDGRVTVPGFDSCAQDLYLDPIRTGDAAIITDPNPDRWLETR